jgi:hypothetical protein
MKTISTKEEDMAKKVKKTLENGKVKRKKERQNRTDKPRAKTHPYSISLPFLHVNWKRGDLGLMVVVLALALVLYFP